jgi:hypothetical protein
MTDWTHLDAVTMGDFARYLTERDVSLARLAGLGKVMLLIACAKRGDTILESRDILREHFNTIECDLLTGWDQLRRFDLSTKGEKR